MAERELSLELIMGKAPQASCIIILHVLRASVQDCTSLGHPFLA